MRRSMIIQKYNEICCTISLNAKLINADLVFQCNVDQQYPDSQKYFYVLLAIGLIKEICKSTILGTIIDCHINQI